MTLGGSYLLSHPKTRLLVATTLQKAELEEEDEEDGPDLALQQDADLTRDPRTGTVPRERLVEAARYNEEQLSAVAQQRTTTQSLAFATWTERGPSNIAGRLLSLLIDPADATGGTVWAGSAGGGLWKVTSATSASYSWTNVNTSLSNLAVSTIATTPGTSPAVMYCGTGEGFFNSDAMQGAGIWKSTDGGTTWAQLSTTNNSNFYYTQKIVVHPVTKDVYAATRSGLWRSTNGGTSWSQVLSTTTSTVASSTNRVADIEIGADNTLFVSFGIFSTDGIYRSATGNVGDWTKLNTLGGSGLPTTGYQRIELACAPSDANRLYAVFQTTTSNSLLNVYRSSDKGNTWVALSRPGGGDYTNGQAWYNLAIAVSPADPNAVYVGGLDLWFTSDAGNATPANITWDNESGWSLPTSSPFYVHADHHAIAFVPTGTAPANKAYFGSDGGLAYSADASISNASQPTFSGRNNGLNVTQFYALAAHPTSFDYFLAGAQDNGTLKFTTAGINATTTATGGDGGFCAIDQDDPTVQFTSYVYNQYRRSTNSGGSFTTLNLSASNGSFINPWEYDSQANVLYACYDIDTYLAWTNPVTAANVGAATLLNPSLGAGAGRVTHITVSPLTNNRIYVGTDAGKLLRVDNANTATPTIATIRAGSAGTSVSCVAIDPANESHLLVTYANYGIVSVYETTNGGTVWTNVEGALPDMPVRWALFDPRNTSRAMLATEMGVYTTDALSGGSTSWQPALYATMNTRVDMLRYRSGDKAVAAATHGRGLFTSNVFALASLPLPVQLTSFTGRATDQGVALRWQTASELNARSFEVERSMDGKGFELLASVKAAGTSNTSHSYAHTDGTAGPGRYFYRLHQIDFNGTAAYSPIVAVDVKAVLAPLFSSAYPNPFGQELTLQLPQPIEAGFTATLTDSKGRVAFAAPLRGTGRQLPLTVPAGLASGAYLLTVRGGGKQTTQRVMHR